MSSKDHEPWDIPGLGIKRGQLAGLEQDNVINAFSGYVDEVLAKINDGKEATVYLCRASEAVIKSGEVATPFLAAKMYRPRQFRAFETDRNYRNFGKMRDRRLAKAMRARSKVGQREFHHHWIESEFKVLETLFEAGVRVPRPYLCAADGILMAHVGTQEGTAPMLVHCHLDDDEATRLLGEILKDVARMIENDLVHGDLSAYNILYDGIAHTIIDVPQAVDPRTTPDAYNLFQRDLINVEKYFSRYKLEIPVGDLMRKYF